MSLTCSFSTAGEFKRRWRLVQNSGGYVANNSRPGVTTKWSSQNMSQLSVPKVNIAFSFTELFDNETAERRIAYIVLMAHPYRNRSPVACVWDAFSEPARSIIKRKVDMKPWNCTIPTLNKNVKKLDYFYHFGLSFKLQFIHPIT